MRPVEVATLLTTASAYQANLKPSNDQAAAEMAKAWYMALDMRMTLHEATLILAELASSARRIHPGTINDLYLESVRAGHAQGVGRPRLPYPMATPKREAPRAIGAPEPVKPQDVPEYVAARAAAVERAQQRAEYNRVACPHCHAEVGKPCKDGNGNVLMRSPAHPSRLDALRTVAA